MIPSATLRQTLTIVPRTGEGAARPLYDEANPVTYKARIEAKRRQSRDDHGGVRVSEYVAQLRPEAAASVGDRAIVFARSLVVLKVTELRDLTRLVGYELEIGESGASR